MINIISFDFFDFAEVNWFIWEEGRWLHWHELTHSEEEDQDDSDEHSETSNDARHDVVVDVVHVPALDSKRCTCGVRVQGLFICRCDARHQCRDQDFS